MRVKLARVRVVFEEVDCPEDCGWCGAATITAKAVNARHLGEFTETGELAKAPKGLMVFASGEGRIHGKVPVCVRELRCARCGHELAALPIKVSDVKEAAEDAPAQKDLAAA